MTSSDLDTGDCEGSAKGAGYYTEKLRFTTVSCTDQIVIDGSWQNSTGYVVLVRDSDHSIVWQGGDATNPASKVFGPLTLPACGHYTVWVTTSNSGETGPYTAIINLRDGDETCPNGQSLQPNGQCGTNPDGSKWHSSKFNTNLDINATISIGCDESADLNRIIGTGYSTIDDNNRVLCTVITNNSSGYKLEWSATDEVMRNVANDTISAYTPAVADTPETWSVAASASEWGAKLGASSTTYDAGAWGNADSYGAGKWLNISSTPRQIVSRSTETTMTGDQEYLSFGLQVGADKLQPTGIYGTQITVTATAL